MTHDVWVEVDLDALEHNVRQVKSHIGDSVRIVAVVKANGYGHGAVESALAFERAGADMLAVTRLEEALLLRDGGLEMPILMLAPAQPDNFDLSVRLGLDHTISNLEAAASLSAAAANAETIARAHIKIDTGMARIGADPSDAISLLRDISQLPAMSVVGCYTHFACATDTDTFLTHRQIKLFSDTLSGMRSVGLNFGLAHAANSAAALRFPQSRLDMVRVGTLLYGQYPSQHVPHVLNLANTWKLKARICEVKVVPAGSTVGYGSEHTLRRQARLGVIPIGWADGFGLIPEGPVYRQSVVHFAIKKMRRHVCVGIADGLVPVVGRVSMQMTTIDVTGLNDVRVGDEVTLRAARIPVNALVPRVYMRSGDYRISK